MRISSAAITANTARLRRSGASRASAAIRSKPIRVPYASTPNRSMTAVLVSAFSTPLSWSSRVRRPQAYGHYALPYETSSGGRPERRLHPLTTGTAEVRESRMGTA
ncbi:hypothetical protein GCM10009765_64070 [Fodinicola feengrottensis]|uniref:Uncharacterized protein n=1 Tax=Fodinicola feengrottensis TaxID=435914 RepID=A0ABN2IIT7_9ACTN